MSKRKTNNDNKYPSSAKPSKTINFSIERKTLIQIIILIFMALIILGCTANKNTTKKVFCNDGFHTTYGWVSAESGSSYWVVSDNGKAVEFNKQKCSITD